MKDNFMKSFHQTVWLLLLLMIIIMNQSIHHYHQLSRSINTSFIYHTLPIDISWIEYLHEIYGTSSSDYISNGHSINGRKVTMHTTNEMHPDDINSFIANSNNNLSSTKISSISKNQINFYYRNSGIRIQPLNWPINRLFLHQKVKDDQRNQYRTGYKSKKYFNDYSWVEVNRFSSNFLNKYSVTRSNIEWVEGYSNGLTGNTSIISLTSSSTSFCYCCDQHHYHHHYHYQHHHHLDCIIILMKMMVFCLIYFTCLIGNTSILVPYGCWFMLAQGSGIFINIGKSLKINDLNCRMTYSYFMYTTLMNSIVV